MEDASGLVVASNRGPVRWTRRDDGSLAASRGFGGLVTALGGALQAEPGTWVSLAMSDDDREMASRHEGKAFEVDTDEGVFRLRTLDAGDHFDPHYNVVSNRLLWFTLHNLWDAPYEPAGVGWRSAWDDGYVPVNEMVAEAVAAEAEAGREIYSQDYHLCLTPRMVRERVPQARILHYLHTPWVGGTTFSRLPDRVSRGILEGLLAADVVAFSSPAWCRSFRQCAAELLDAHVEGEAVHYEGRRTVVADFTLGVDEADLSASASSDPVARAGEDLDAELDGRRLILRVDRTDLSKNILRGLRAFELLLEREPAYRDTVWHYAHLNPSRQDVPAYARYVEACQEVAERIQSRFGEGCLTLFLGDDYPRAVAALQRYDVLLANPVIDGTNLVAKEGPVLNTRDGVLVLSRQAGASAVMGDDALCINPYDTDETADALHAALEMDPGERRRRAETLQRKARLGAPEEWFAAQRYLLRATVARRR